MRGLQKLKQWHNNKLSGRLSLRTILLYVHIVILLLPITGLGVLRVYENELVRRTEAELMAQGAFISAHYKSCWQQVHNKDSAHILENSARYIQDPNIRKKHRGTFKYIPSKVDLNAITLEEPAISSRAPRQGWVLDKKQISCGKSTSALMQEAQHVTLAGMRVVDMHGVVVASSRGDMHRALFHRKEVKRALTKGDVQRLVRKRSSDSPMPSLNSLSRRSSVRLFVAMPIVVKDHVIGAVVVSRTPLSFSRALYENRVVLLMFAISLIIAVVVLSWYTSRTIIKPVHELIEQTRRVGQGDQEARVPIAHPVTLEVESLSRSIVDMANAIEERSDYIKTFASNVSHEFKTPLTSIRGTVELMWDHFEEMSTQERNRFLDIIDRDAERLQRLVGRLLDLARADVFKPGDQETTIKPVLHELIAQHTLRGLACEIVGEIPELNVQMATVTFESIFSNVLDNAKQHGPEDVQVTLSVISHEHMIEFNIEDNGPGVSDANAEKIFRPFFTTARDRGGTGLGLAVIASLITAHEGHIELVESAHTHFRITLPHFRNTI